ncbi:MAG: gliding motility-associated C-terminal domain-containing protein [Tannerellaceae bacterium]|nr:gliding motility-associated C-terminal domain-containing protein [Tannerellaceae bacterium]
MLKKKYGRWVGICCMLLIFLSVHAQYTVKDTQNAPLLAKDDTNNRIQVYLVYGTGNVEISYTSSSTNHQWYRYNTKALEEEPVSSVQNGTTSTIRQVEDGYGYFVQEEGVLSRYIWIIDYSRYAFDLTSLEVDDRGDPCQAVYLTGTGDMPALFYVTPVGATVELEREFTVSYTTMVQREGDKYFVETPVSVTVADPFNTALDAPLSDTSFELTGDLFAEHFGVGKSIRTEVYQAVALAVDTAMVIYSFEGTNVLQEEDSYSAPVEVSLKAYANSPVASLFIWTIYEQQDPDSPLINYTGEEVDYTFNRAGTFLVNLSVTDRTSQCNIEIDPIVIKVRESHLDVPNIFTPGTSPGVNDEFKVVYKSLVSFKGWIFNRWGVEMFHWTDPSQGWDGKKGGKYVSPGVYYYVIEAKGSDDYKYKKTGHINIIRPKNAKDESY